MSIPYLECFFIVQSTPRRIKMLIGIPVFFDVALSASSWWASSHMLTFLLRRIEPRLQARPVTVNVSTDVCTVWVNCFGGEV